eukprot:Gb_36747 [translate_table: standard]
MVQALDDKENIDEIGMVKMNFTKILDYIVKVMPSSQYSQMAMYLLIMKEEETMDWMYISASSFKQDTKICLQELQIHHPMASQPGHLAQDKPRIVKSRFPHPWARSSKYILGIETNNGKSSTWMRTFQFLIPAFCPIVSGFMLPIIVIFLLQISVAACVRLPVLVANNNCNTRRSNLITHA